MASAMEGALRTEMTPPEDELRADIREAPEDIQTLWTDCDTHGNRHNAWRLLVS